MGRRIFLALFAAAAAAALLFATWRKKSFELILECKGGTRYTILHKKASGLFLDEFVVRQGENEFSFLRDRDRKSRALRIGVNHGGIPLGAREGEKKFLARFLAAAEAMFWFYSS